MSKFERNVSKNSRILLEEEPFEGFDRIKNLNQTEYTIGISNMTDKATELLRTIIYEDRLKDTVLTLKETFPDITGEHQKSILVKQGGSINGHPCFSVTQPKLDGVEKIRYSREILSLKINPHYQYHFFETPNALYDNPKPNTYPILGHRAVLRPALLFWYQIQVTNLRYDGNKTPLPLNAWIVHRFYMVINKINTEKLVSPTQTPYRAVICGNTDRIWTEDAARNLNISKQLTDNTIKTAMLVKRQTTVLSNNPGQGKKS